MLRSNKLYKNMAMCRGITALGRKLSTQKKTKPSKPLADEDRIFTNLYGRHDWHLKSAMSRGDWYKTREIIAKGPDWIINELEKSGVRGRGGACFPLGQKLRYMQNIKAPPPRYVVVNGAEGEPGTCKDREIMRHDPQKVLEGALLVGRAICAKEAWIFVRGSFYREACNLQTALIEAYEAGFIGKNACDGGFDFDIYIQRSGGEYISGEETALLKCLMGSEGRPYRKPPYPSEKGVWDQPTILLNLETVSLVPSICRRGSKWFSNLGIWPHSPGTRLFCISGNVERPCTVEENLGISLRDIVDIHSGGVKGGWDNLLAVIPGGPSTPMVHKDACDNLTLDAESMITAKSALGTGAIIVMDKSCDILQVITHVLGFYKATTCRQCTRCRGQSKWAYEFCQQFQNGIGHRQEIDWLWEISEWAAGNAICGFVDANAFAVQGFLRNFRGSIEEKLSKQLKS